MSKQFQGCLGMKRPTVLTWDNRSTFNLGTVVCRWSLPFLWVAKGPPYSHTLEYASDLADQYWMKECAGIILYINQDYGTNMFSFDWWDYWGFLQHPIDMLVG